MQDSSNFKILLASRPSCVRYFVTLPSGGKPVESGKIPQQCKAGTDCKESPQPRWRNGRHPFIAQPCRSHEAKPPCQHGQTNEEQQVQFGCRGDVSMQKLMDCARRAASRTVQPGHQPEK